MSSETPARPSVVVAEDDGVVRYTLKRIVENACDVIGEAADGAAAVELAEQLHPDVVLLDISMPVMTGFEAARNSRAAAGYTHHYCEQPHERFVY